MAAAEHLPETQHLTLDSVPFVIYWLCQNQLTSNTISQAANMETSGVPNDLMPDLNAITVQYAKELAGTGILVNAGCPGYVATDLNGHQGTRTPQQGAAIFLELATLPDDGPSGTFRDETGIQPW